MARSAVSAHSSARRGAAYATSAQPARVSGRAARQAVALGSLTQHGARGERTCRVCGSQRLTHLAMTLTDGTPVDFVSCHRCEHQVWTQADGTDLAIHEVLDKTRKQR